MTQTGIPYCFIRGGSSRGPFFNQSDLPLDRETLSEVLVAAVGSGHPLNIDGIGGGNAVTTKTAILSPSADSWADIDYLFAQVGVENKLVDFKPTCGNMMIGVGPAAIEMGLIEASDDVTEIKIRAVNTNAKVISRVQTPGRLVNYDGDIAIDGVPGTAAPIHLEFKEVAGSSTGKLLPTGQVTTTIDGITLSCIDFAMPMVIGRAIDFGIIGSESREHLDNNKSLFKKIEAIRLAAAMEMGMGDCKDSVTPKFGLISRAIKGGSLCVRYFMPWSTHPTLAVTGAQCLAACLLLPGSIAQEYIDQDLSSPATVVLEHPLGKMEVVIQFKHEAAGVKPISATVVRTARKLAQGEVFIPGAIWKRV